MLVGFWAHPPWHPWGGPAWLYIVTLKCLNVIYEDLKCKMSVSEVKTPQSFWQSKEMTGVAKQLMLRYRCPNLTCLLQSDGCQKGQNVNVQKEQVVKKILFQVKSILIPKQCKGARRRGLNARLKQRFPAINVTLQGKYILDTIDNLFGLLSRTTEMNMKMNFSFQAYTIMHLQHKSIDSSSSIGLRRTTTRMNDESRETLEWNNFSLEKWNEA